MKTLEEIYSKYTTPDGNGDKGTAHSYIEVYEKLLAPYRKNSTFMEIGVSYGLSMLMWMEYFENSSLYGADISCKDENLKRQGYKFIVSDATKPEFISHIADVKFDVIIDDGSHIKHDQLASYHLLKNNIKKNGIYIIEDVVDLDLCRNDFLNLDATKNIEILDRRNIKNRGDDVLIIIRDKK